MNVEKQIFTEAEAPFDPPDTICLRASHVRKHLAMPRTVTSLSYYEHDRVMVREYPAGPITIFGDTLQVRVRESVVWGRLEDPTTWGSGS